MINCLDQLKAVTDVVADTGDIEAIRQYKPVDATTNPSLLLKAAALSQYAYLVDSAKTWSKSKGGSDDERLANCADKFAISIGSEILKIIPGRVSTEVDSRLSFDTQGTIDKAKRLIGLYENEGISKDRILIKMASSWEGIRAAEQLEKEGINCNLTLLFGFSQAAACADAGVFLISPFVGRILDWYKADTGRDSYPAKEDPGVLSVVRIFNFYKQQHYSTVVMGASFRNIGEIKALAGCDRLTIAPPLLAELEADTSSLKRRLDITNTGKLVSKPMVDEGSFRWLMNEDAMATEKLAEGIRNFTIDQVKLENLLRL
ncbi:MAG: transaldolase [Pseudomonadales bacterium]|nr:transaldolase [Pseudomonadales bacterium]